MICLNYILRCCCHNAVTSATSRAATVTILSHLQPAEQRILLQCCHICNLQSSYCHNAISSATSRAATITMLSHLQSAEQHCHNAVTSATSRAAYTVAMLSHLQPAEQLLSQCCQICNLAAEQQLLDIKVLSLLQLLRPLGEVLSLLHAVLRH